MQVYTSKNTSLNQIPALIKKALPYMNGANFDNGAGKYQKASEYLKDNGIENVAYDKFNRPQEENEKALQHSKCHTSTIANVLNVIDSIEAMKQVLALSKNMSDITFISVYEGDKSGKGRKTKDDCYQQNKPLKWYLPIVKQVFDKVEIKQGMIIAQ